MNGTVGEKLCFGSSDHQKRRIKTEKFPLGMIS